MFRTPLPRNRVQLAVSVNPAGNLQILYTERIYLPAVQPLNFNGNKFVMELFSYCHTLHHNRNQFEF
jgi:hypothetical protein